MAAVGAAAGAGAGAFLSPPEFWAFLPFLSAAGGVGAAAAFVIFLGCAPLSANTQKLGVATMSILGWPSGIVLHTVMSEM